MSGKSQASATIRGWPTMTPLSATMAPKDRTEQIRVRKLSAASVPSTPIERVTHTMKRVGSSGVNPSRDSTSTEKTSFNSALITLRYAVSDPTCQMSQTRVKLIKKMGFLEDSDRPDRENAGRGRKAWRNGEPSGDLRVSSPR